jgi:hypothetical protein
VAPHLARVAIVAPERKEWLIVAVGVALALLAWVTRGTAVGEARVEYLFTVVPADATGVACASDQAIATFQCEFDGANRPTGAAHVLQPFVTVSGERVLLAGVFEGAALSAWRNETQRSGRTDRVTVRCRGRALGDVTSVRIRWSPTSEWSPPTGSFAANADECSLVE